MLNRTQVSRRRARSRKSKLLSGAAKPVLENLERRSLLSAGLLDTTANGSGSPFNDPDGYVTERWGDDQATGTALAVQSDGSVIVAAGILGPAGYQVGVAKYDSTGALDTGFGTLGRLVFDAVGDLDTPLAAGRSWHWD
jgi:hypothetical protein